MRTLTICVLAVCGAGLAIMGAEPSLDLLHPANAAEVVHQQPATTDEANSNPELVSLLRRLNEQLLTLNARVSALESPPLVEAQVSVELDSCIPVRCSGPGNNTAQNSAEGNMQSVQETWTSELPDPEWQFTMQESVAGFDDYLLSVGASPIGVTTSGCHETLCRLTFDAQAAVEGFKIKYFLAQHLQQSSGVVEVTKDKSGGVIYIRKSTAS